MIGDKEERTLILLEPIVRKSKILRASSIRSIREYLPQHVFERMRFLNDEEAIAVKRIATSKLLDFPHVQISGSFSGVIKIGSPISESAISHFLDVIKEDDVFIFMEPWLVCGSALLSAKLLASVFWEILERCDYTLKIYDSGLTKSCILSADEDEKELSFKVAK